MVRWKKRRKKKIFALAPQGVLRSPWKCHKSKVHKISDRFGISKKIPTPKNLFFSAWKKNHTKNLIFFLASELFLHNFHWFSFKMMIFWKFPPQNQLFWKISGILLFDRKKNTCFSELEKNLTYQIDQKFYVLSISDTFRSIRALPGGARANILFVTFLT